MLPSICRHACNMSSVKAHTLSRMLTLSALRAARKSKSFETTSHLIRRASTQPKKPAPPRWTSQPASSPSAPQNAEYKAKSPPSSSSCAKNSRLPPVLSKIIIYHLGQGRVFMMGALKVSSLIMFGVFTAAVLPAYADSWTEWWQAPIVLVAATGAVVAIWFLTYPMVLWMHIRVPKDVQRSQVLLQKFLTRPTADMDVYITTMGPIGKPRITQIKLAELEPVQQRGGLVNYIRDTAQENKERQWYQYRALGKFMIMDEEVPTTNMRKGQKPTKWLWYSLIKNFRRLHGTSTR